MKRILQYLIPFSAALLLSFSVSAKENVPNPDDSGRPRQFRTSDECAPATSSSTLDINNVRALLHNGGDMWWDLVGNPRYEVPKVDDPANARHSLFAGSLWIGGLDGSGVLRIAAQTYRQSGNDFFPGPIRTDDGTVEDEECAEWDVHFKVSRDEIDRFRSAVAGGTVNVADFPGVNNWPGVNPNPGFERKLAPFFDADNNQDYNPSGGDFPLLFEEQPSVLPDQMVFWVINDRGDIHTETQGEQIGVEIQMQAFAFATSNAVNDMTFYKQTVINRSTNTLRDAYIGQWVDSDVGFYNDDWVGCDTIRGLGVGFNGAAFDGTATGYGSNPPAVGVDFFQGPFADDPNIDNNNDGVIDQDDERLGMSKFIYYNNDFTRNGNPEIATHFYGYLTGFWKNGAPVVDDRDGNGNGFPDSGENAEATDYMFPDYPGPGSCQFVSYSSEDKWSEFSNGNQPFDRRFIQSAGPFTLRPGAVNEIVTGVVWARDENNEFDNEQYGSFCKLLAADDVAQRLFDANFDLLDGPDAPFVSIEEYDRELVLTWDYANYGGPDATNNFYEDYSEVDPLLSPTIADRTFDFEGYIVYQLIDDGVSASELDDPSKARVLFQCDKRNDVSTIINRTVIATEAGEIIQDEVMVEGANEGLVKSLRVTQDLFADDDDSRLVNYRTYYYTVVAYAHNDTSSDGRKFILGNGKFARYSSTPHRTEFENFGQTMNSEYGDGPPVTLVQGSGSGGRFLQLTDQTMLDVVQSGSVANPTFEGGAAPIVVTINNPKRVGGDPASPVRNYRLVINRDTVEVDTSISASTGDTLVVRRMSDWQLYDAANTSEPIYTSVYVESSLNNFEPSPEPLSGTLKPIIQNAGGEVIDHGISIGVNNAQPPGDWQNQENNGFVGSEVTFRDLSAPWLSGLPDQDNFGFLNWIRSGGIAINETELNQVDLAFRTYGFADSVDHRAVFDYNWFDEQKQFQEVVNGTWAPYCMSANYSLQQNLIGPRINFAFQMTVRDGDTIPPTGAADPREMVTLDKLNNVDVVFTPNPDLWSRCVVVETSPTQAQGSGAYIMSAKWRRSRGKSDANYTPAPPNSADEEYGMSWFPGYAVDVETGQRLNIFFGESTWHAAQNGDDMLWNPVSLDFGENAFAAFGRHYIYVTKEPYDECQRIANALRVDPALVTKDLLPPAYIGQRIFFYENAADEEPTKSLPEGFRDVAWTSVPAVLAEQFAFEQYEDIPSEVTVSLRVNAPFRPDTTANNDEVVYDFDVSDLIPEVRVKEVAEASLDDILIVPNPYYGRSGVGRGRYERNQLDTRVKITNLPQQCDIRIFTLNGHLVRRFRKDSNEPSIDWDLKNDFAVPISSGLYVIHIDGEELGEKVLKFFCVMPEPDLNAY